MADSKLTNLLKTLSPEEFKKFEKFIDSPYHNKGRDLIPFFKILKSYYPGFSDTKLTNEYIYKKLFPEKKYDNVRSENLIRTLSSHMFRICKDFLIQIELEKQQSKKKYFLLNQLRKKKLYKEFDKEFSGTDFDEEEKGNLGSFVDSHLLCSVKRDCSLERDDFINAFEYTIQASENISAAAMISAFKFEDEKNLGKAYGINIRRNFLDAILGNFDSVNFLGDLREVNVSHFSYMQIYQGIYMMNKHKDKKEYYHQLKELLKKYSHLFGQPENYVLWNIMQTYCGVNRMGYAETLDIQKYTLENNMYKPHHSENFHVVLFRNIVLNATAAGDYEWLEKFIEKYHTELHEMHRDNMKVYSMAYLYFAKRDFEKALENILEIKLNLFLFKTDVKILQLKIFYELGYFEEALSLVSATLSYLHESKYLNELHRENISIFAKCFRDLIKIKSGPEHSPDELFRLKQQTKKILFTGLTDYLDEKIGELEK